MELQTLVQTQSPGTDDFEIREIAVYYDCDELGDYIRDIRDHVASANEFIQQVVLQTFGKSPEELSSRIEMTFKGNVRRLNKILELAPRASKDKIRELIKLYEDRKIPKFRSVELASVKLANPGLFKDANNSYTELLNRYQEAEPVAGALSRPPKRKRESVETFL